MNNVSAFRPVFTLRTIKSTLGNDRSSCAKLFMILVSHSKVGGGGLSFGLTNSNYYLFLKFLQKPCGFHCVSVDVSMLT